MSTVNKAIVIGNIGQDPEVRYSSSGDAMCSLSVATSYKAKDKDEETEWHRVSLFGRTAEVAGEYLRKGSKVYIEGRLRTRKYKDKEGNDRSITEILCDRLVMLGERQAEGESRRPAPERAPHRPSPPAPRRAPAPPTGFDDMDDDVPF